MIVPENILKQIFAQLPKVVDSNLIEFSVGFNWGSQDALNLFLSQKEISAKYPLIWMVESPEDTTQAEVIKSVKLIIAKNSQHQTNTNPIIWQTEFETVLNPILENVVKALERSEATFIVKRNDVKYKVQRLANYSEDGTNAKTIDNWNVIIFEAEINFNSNCINTINFNF